MPSLFKTIELQLFLQKKSFDGLKKITKWGGFTGKELNAGTSFSNVKAFQVAWKEFKSRVALSNRCPNVSAQKILFSRSPRE